MTTAVARATPRLPWPIDLDAYDRSPTLSQPEQAVLASVCSRRSQMLLAHDQAALGRLVQPIHDVLRMAGLPGPSGARNVLLREMHHRQLAFWAWDEPVWSSILGSSGRVFQETVTSEAGVRLRLLVVAYKLCGLRRLHRRVGMVRLRQFADLAFGPSAVQAAVDEVNATLISWRASEHTIEWEVTNATLDLLLTCGSPRLEDVQEAQLVPLVAEYPAGTSRRRGLFKVSRVLAHKGIISAPLTSNHHHRGPTPETLESAPAEWLEWALRWRRLATHEPATVRGMFSTILIAGRWAAEKHPDSIGPEKWTRDMAAEYVADTLQATIGQWAGVNRNRTRWGQPLSAVGKAQRMDALRSFFIDLIEWEWIKARFDPRQVLSLPLSIRAQIGPNPRIIDEVAWAKLMAAGLTLNMEDLSGYGTPAARRLGYRSTYYPIELVRALVGVWLFGGCRIDEIRRLEVDCIVWDEGTDATSGEKYQVCLLRIPQNKTSSPFNKPVDPVVGQLVDAWKLVRPAQPLLEDRKTHERREYLFCFRGQLVGAAYLNNQVIPALCRKAGLPDADSRGALTSHRARATIATQLLNADEPLTLADLQQWLGHKHPSSTRHYAAILQRKLSAAYKKADYFARNVRTIQVLLDRDTILSGAAAGGEPWKYYDLGEGFCTYDFFARCPHRLACARCPFYLPKSSSKGQLLAVKEGIDRMLERVDLTDEERAVLEGDCVVLTSLVDRLADVPTPAGPTPRQLGTVASFVPLTNLLP